MAFERVTVDPDLMGGSLHPALPRAGRHGGGDVADGMSADEILADLPYLEREDIAEALRFAAGAVRERELPIL
jgi:uncharacterized protein (DUF433 family)